MSQYLEPAVGPGLRPPTSPGTGPSMHGRVVNPPRYAPIGGLNAANKAVTGNEMKISSVAGSIKKTAGA